MGATTWAYFTPFHADVASALQVLREKTFADGAYSTPASDFDKAQHERNLDYLKKLYEAMEHGPVRDNALRCVVEARDAGEQLQTEHRRRRKPRTIASLLKQCGESGTHSILDIERVSSGGEPMAVSPLSREFSFALEWHADRLRIREEVPRFRPARHAFPSFRLRPSNVSPDEGRSCAACREWRSRERRVRAGNEPPPDFVREPRDAAEQRQPCPCVRCSNRRREGARSLLAVRADSTSLSPWAAHRTRNGARLLHADSRRSGQLQRR